MTKERMIEATQSAILAFSKIANCSISSGEMQLTANLLTLMLSQVGPERLQQRIDYLIKEYVKINGD